MISNLESLKSKDKNPSKRELHNKMLRQAFIIAKAFPFGKANTGMVDKYSLLIDEYYKKFPDKVAHARLKQKIARLRGMIKWIEKIIVLIIVIVI